MLFTQEEYFSFAALAAALLSQTNTSIKGGAGECRELYKKAEIPLGGQGYGKINKPR